MGKLIVHQDKVTDIKAMVSICPFNALEEKDGKLEVNAGCKLCKLCVKKGQPGAMEFVEEEVKTVDKSLWKGITVYVDHVNGEIHPVTFELLGKAGELAKKINHPVYAIFIGSDIENKAEELLHYGADKVFVVDAPELKDFQMESYTAAFEAFINEIKPSAILVGATPVGRQLAPRVASRFNTGLTADCTILDIHENTDLVQIRPAFGGNIMAEILTPNSRPQLATVRYKIMDAPERSAEAKGEIVKISVAADKLKTRTQVLGITQKQKEKSIENADILVVAGRGLKKKEDLDLVRQLADALGGDIACTRPLAEAGWLDAKHQIGLSGRTVRPRLIITCGVSGAIQFVAGMNNSENIFAINTDPNAGIFKVANYAVIGDIYEVIPKLIEQVKQGKGVKA
ncbi:MAG: electron transfer flavoprotein subunit alpha [Anaerovibrio sp.]|uniref:electron transfer flavoprotein subunit alpha n=1 Tax=Anaerovibrio sp. TaxID=1872532 RepID=UPI0025B882CC|nr:electron transfer flavoprotein subunit alpha [Anaerovibrio sp.]MBE6099768.1 electron transfer flavoprotein subunit alpha [Anaerovibrio sp.]MBQ1855730.1 electron transfer flavoprotein subunit alpha [Anaerovibrio sp.]